MTFAKQKYRDFDGITVIRGYRVTQIYRSEYSAQLFHSFIANGLFTETLRIIQQRAEDCTRLIFTFRFDSRIAATVAPRFLGVRRISSANHIFSGSVTFHA
jgi:hypothetical protein